MSTSNHDFVRAMRYEGGYTVQRSGHTARTSCELLASYSGLVPGTRSRGGVERNGGIKHEGNSWFQLAMVEVAMVRLRYDIPVTQ